MMRVIQAEEVIRQGRQIFRNGTSSIRLPPKALMPNVLLASYTEKPTPGNLFPEGSPEELGSPGCKQAVAAGFTVVKWKWIQTRQCHPLPR